MEPMKLTALLGELTASATALQGSLLARDTDGIWRNMDRQEAVLRDLNQAQSQAGSLFRETFDSCPEARSLLHRGLAVVQANRALCQRFLDVVGQLMQQMGNRQVSGYPGVSTGCCSPMLLNRKG